jgi:hypothetical protein
MAMESRLNTAKFCCLTGFLILLATTYWLRSEVLGLTRIRFSADERKVELERKQNRESFADRQKEHEIAQKNYDLQLKHYEKLMALYEQDFEAYAKLPRENLVVPQIPNHPVAPTPPEVTDQFRNIQSEFVLRRYRYFAVSEIGNWIACFAAVLLVGGLLYLLLFDAQTNRFVYVASLLLSFVFLIGPSFHSVLSAVIGLLKGPDGY